MFATPRLYAAFVITCLAAIAACGARHTAALPEKESHELTMLFTVDDGNGSSLTTRLLTEFEQRSGTKVHSLNGFDSVDTRFNLYQQLFAKHSPQPDICELDIIWPEMLADSLVDLKSYLGQESARIDWDLVNAFTVNGKLVGIPVMTDMAMLYYRTDLLAKYGYSRPPQTWVELGRMARVIQAGERKAGHDDFWGYLWQGASGESLTCNALEWQHGEGVADFTGSNPSCFSGEGAELALTQAREWVSAISPPGVVEYEEQDSENIWLAGSAAFVRAWSGLYKTSQLSKSVSGRFAVAPLPAGNKARGWVAGSMAMGVSRYSRHPEEAARAIRFLASTGVQAQFADLAANIPTDTSLLNDPAALRHTAFEGWLGRHWREEMFLRPARALGKRYQRFSSLYSAAVHDVITGKRSAHEAMTQLQQDLASEFYPGGQIWRANQPN